MKKRNIQNYINKCPAYIWCGIILIIMSIIMFHDFLFGNKYFLFPNNMIDATSQFYPSYIELAEKWAEKKSFQWFSMASGWGRTISVNNPFDFLVIAFGKENVAMMMGIVVVIRLIIAGTIFSAFLECKKMNRFTAIAMGICYAFSTQVFVGGCWKTQAELAIITAIFLLAIEKVKSQRKWFGVIVGLCFMELCLSLYFKLTLMAFLFLYIVAEHFMESENKTKKFSFKAKIIFGSVVIISGMIMFVAVFPQLREVLHSVRFQEGIASFGEAWKKTFSLVNAKILVTTFLRTISPNILGTSDERTYYGSETGRYLDDGSFYCGILVLLVLFYVFKKEKKRRNIVITFALVGCGILIVCPAVRLLANGFAGETFKLTRMWGTLILIYIEAYALEEIFADREKFSLRKLVIMWGCLGSISLIIIMLKMSDKIYLKEYILYLIFSSVYILIFVGYKKEWLSENKIKCIIIGVIGIEMLALNYPFVNNSDAVTREEWENGYYNDGTEEAISSVEEASDFYRVDKSYCSVFLNDAQAQKYNGTMYYIGGIGSDSQTEFLKKFGLPLLNNMSGYCYGTYGYPEIESLMSVKYIVTQGNTNVSYGFEEKNSLEGKTIYENTNWLPFGFCYDKIMTSSQLEKIAPERRKEYLLDYLVVDQEVEEMKIENPVKISVTEQEPQEQLKIDNYVTGTVIEVPQNTENDTIVIKVKNDDEVAILAGWSSQGSFENNLRFANVYEENGTGEVVLSNQKDVQYIILYDQFGEEGKTLDEVEISIYNTEQYYKKYAECISERKESALTLESYSDEYIKGTIENKKNQLLFISIPYSADFEYYVDGEKAEKIRADYAFTAIYLEKGEHTIEMVCKKGYISKRECVLLVLLVTACIGGIRKITKKFS